MNEEHETLVTDCEARESRLSDWERGFIDSMRKLLDNNGALTQKQSDKLSEVWERVTEKG